jgi:hypothetical protein
MKCVRATLCLLAAIVFISSGAQAFPAKIVSGQMLLSGTAYGTPDYQTYLRFDLTARTKIPRRDYRFLAEQTFSVYLNHPVQPNGAYKYTVIMPYAPMQMRINDQAFAPVWYAECVWNIESSAETPVVTPVSPLIVTIDAPFTMSGNSLTYGAYTLGAKTSGKGTVALRFQKDSTKYFLREANYVFSEN